MSDSQLTEQSGARDRYTGAPSGRFRSIAQRAGARLRWLGWELRVPRLRGGPPVSIGAGAAIAVSGAGRLERGEHVVLKRDVTLAIQATLEIGAATFIGRGSHVTCFRGVSIGTGV